MKDTKIYKAATLREALEQIKRERGEETLVLGHKQVRVGGFLGLGSREMVEVRIADEAHAANTNRTAAHSRQSSKPDEAKAHEARNQKQPIQAEQKPAFPFAALATRAYAENSGLESNLAAATNLNNATNRAVALAAPQKSRSLEALGVTHSSTTLSSTALSSTALASTPPVSSIELAAAPAEPAPTRANSVVTELNRMRMELRELKLSIAISNRTATAHNGSQERLADFETDPEIYDSPNYEAYMQLIETGLAPDFARLVMQNVVRSADRKRTVKAALTDLLDSKISFAEDFLTVNHDSPDEPVANAFIGPTGVGKTTTIAKLAAHVALAARRRAELITLDTHRIAAADQLKKYAEIIGVGFHIAHSVAELEQLTRSFAGKARVFIDTAGRSPYDLADQLELADYLRAEPSILKTLVLQATTHPSDAMAAIKKFALYGSQQLVITKLDETARTGAAIGIASDSGLPLSYICAGQRVPGDIQRANSLTLASHVLRTTTLVAAAAA